jgi:hypothetical protein
MAEPGGRIHLSLIARPGLAGRRRSRFPALMQAGRARRSAISRRGRGRPARSRTPSTGPGIPTPPGCTCTSAAAHVRRIQKRSASSIAPSYRSAAPAAAGIGPLPPCRVRRPCDKAQARHCPSMASAPSRAGNSGRRNDKAQRADRNGGGMGPALPQAHRAGREAADDTGSRRPPATSRPSLRRPGR